MEWCKNKVTFLILYVFKVSVGGFYETPFNLTCGKDTSPISVVYEGVARIETYPWMGHLIYPTKTRRYTTVIVLVTKQMALGTATEIDKLPKTEFRSRARAVFGYNCSGPSVPIRDYSYHPDYETNSYSALAMVQLETDFITIDLHPICPPPTYFIEPEFFAMTIMNNCKKPVVKLYEMDFVNPDECKTYYRKSGLDISSMWPTHTTCARAVSGGECVWRSGAVLALRQGGRWRLVGFGVYGPGCGAPARFLDYSIFQRWVRHSVANIGRPAISRLSPNAMVLRRSLSNLQRYGPCDLDEMKYVIYADHTDIQFRGLNMRTVRYNVTIYAGMEYSCVLFKADNAKKYVKPRLYLRRWCAGAAAMCQDFQNIEIEFYVEIHYKDSVTYDVKAYGREARAIDVRRAMKYINENKKRP